MATNMIIRNISPELHKGLKTEAVKQGEYLQDFVHNLLAEAMEKIEEEAAKK